MLSRNHRHDSIIALNVQALCASSSVASRLCPIPPFRGIKDVRFDHAEHTHPARLELIAVQHHPTFFLWTSLCYFRANMHCFVQYFFSIESSSYSEGKEKENKRRRAKPKFNKSCKSKQSMVCFGFARRQIVYSSSPSPSSPSSLLMLKYLSSYEVGPDATTWSQSRMFFFFKYFLVRYLRYLMVVGGQIKGRVVGLGWVGVGWVGVGKKESIRWRGRSKKKISVIYCCCR